MIVRYAIFTGGPCPFLTKTGFLDEKGNPRYMQTPICDYDSTFDTQDAAIAEANRHWAGEQVGFVVQEVRFTE